MIILYYYGYTIDVSYLLSRLCTHEGRVPQGAPTSPYLSNIICLKLDKRLSKLAEKCEADYTRYMTLRPLKELSQGDILSKIPFSYFGDDGEQKYFVTEALVLSTSCHIDQKNSVVLVPVFPLEKFEGNIQELKKNKIFDYMYIPDGIMSDKYIDFEYMNTYSKKLIMLGFEKDKV